MELIPARVVEICPVFVVEICPVLVVEICPVFVVEICPVFVVEICPDFANVVADRAVTNNAAQITDLRVFIVLLLVIRVRGTWSAWKFAAKPFFQADLSNK